MDVELRYTPRPVPVRFLRRPNRFLAYVQARGRARWPVHVPNPGRMRELLRPGRTEGYVWPTSSPGRATDGTLVTVRHRSTLVSIDTLAANRIVGRALAAGRVPGLPADGWRAEVPVGHHRFDFARFEAPNPRPVHLLEVKSSNLRIGNEARFPDAPTVRGAAHLRALGSARRAGVRADVLFVVQRDDIERFAPHRELDPVFGHAYDVARRAGVRMQAVRLHVAADRLAWGRSVPVEEPSSQRI